MSILGTPAALAGLPSRTTYVYSPHPDDETLYLAAYGLFRFGVEFVRGNEVAWQGMTRPQLFLLATVPLLLAALDPRIRFT